MMLTTQTLQTRKEAFFLWSNLLGDVPEARIVAKQSIETDNQVRIEEYLDLKQLTQRIPFSKRAIENFISKGSLVEGIHFNRPGGGKKRIFFWSAIEAWLRNQDHSLRAEHASMGQTRFPLS